MSDRLRHLDGLRAISVTLVFLFHAHVLGATGGFLGVSVFFTVSGYLLTHRLLQVEPTWSSARRYWGARWRRILPASIAVLIVVVAYEIVQGIDTGGPRRVWFTALGLSNWLQVIEGNSYADLFAAPDMLLHYWSLAIEEQVYLLLPLVLFACLRRSRRTAVVALSALAITSFALPTLFGMSLTRAYYGTDTRAGEILIGALLALAHVGLQGADTRRLLPRRISSWAGLAALAAIIALSVTVHPTSDVIRTGLLPLMAVLSMVVLHACRVDPRFAWGLLERRPAIWLGRLSYPVYLVHWPVLVILLDAGWSPAGSAVVGAVITVALAWPLDRWVERPLRFGVARRARTLAGAGAVVALVSLTLLIPEPTPSRAFLDRLEAQDDDLVERIPAAAATSSSTVAATAAPDPTTPGTTTTSTVPPPPPTVGVFGDSLARSIALVLASHVPDEVVPFRAVATALGCGLVTDLAPERCAGVLDQWRTELAERPVDVAVVASCQWELLDRDIPGVGVRHVGEPEMDALILAEYRRAADALIAGGADVVAWTTCGAFAQTVGFPPEPEFQASRDPARAAALNRLIAQLAAGSDGSIVVLDLAPWVDARREDATIRPDGSHFAWEQPTLLVDELIRLLRPVLDSVDN